MGQHSESGKDEIDDEEADKVMDRTQVLGGVPDADCDLTTEEIMAQVVENPEPTANCVNATKILSEAPVDEESTNVEIIAEVLVDSDEVSENEANRTKVISTASANRTPEAIKEASSRDD